MKIKENESIPNSEVFILENGEPVKKNIENFLNKEVDLGDYSGIRFLGISLENSKIIDKQWKKSKIGDGEVVLYGIKGPFLQ